MRYLKNLLKLLFVLLFLTVLGLGAVFLIMKSSMPTKGQQGVDADQFATRVQETVQRRAWAKTGAIKWSIFNRHYLWDLRRGLVQVKFDPYTILFDVNLKRSVVRRGTKELKSAQADRLLEDTYKQWMRDVFILEPTHTLFNEGVKRFIVDKDLETESLFVYYEKGGLSVGDSYQWYVNENGFPMHIKIWSKEYPTKGIPISFQKWKILKTGLKVSTLRHVAFLSIDIDVKADLSLTHLIGRTDPFKAIEPDPFEASPSSQPNDFPGNDSIELF